MKIHEYQAKELLAAEGAAVPQGKVVTTPLQALEAFDFFGGTPVVIKAQVHAGGRGKGKFLGSSVEYGGVRFITNRAEVTAVATVMLTYPLQTKQTGTEGQKVLTLLVQKAADISREYYLGMVLDRGLGLPVMMASAEGGVDIEEVAKHSPDKILKETVSPELGLLPFQARKLAFSIGLTGNQIGQAEAIMCALSKVFLKKDCSLAEINPLVVTTNGEVQALDAKIVFDDNALYKHLDVASLRDESEEDPAELRAAQAGLSFVRMEGSIGCLVNGAGLAMSTMDIVKYHGGDPANFLDVGGGATQEQVTEAFRILLSDCRVKAVLVNIFGGIMKCDIIAKAILAAFKEVGFHVPLVVRLEGTNVEEGRRLLADSQLAIVNASDMADAAKKVVAAANLNLE